MMWCPMSGTAYVDRIGPHLHVKDVPDMRDAEVAWPEPGLRRLYCDKAEHGRLQP